VIEELSRKTPITPLVIHQLDKRMSIDGFSIPKGTGVIANFYAANHDPETWDMPGEFRPERFLDSNGCFEPSKQVFQFGIGPRSCLGEQLAKMSIFLFLTSLVQRFEFHPDPKAELPDLSVGSPAVVFVPSPFNIIAKLR